MDNYTFTPGNKIQTFLKLALRGAPGAGKTYTSAQLMAGLLGLLETNSPPNTFAVADCEHRAGMYHHIFPFFDVCPVYEPFNTDKLIGIINAAITNGYKGLIIDTLSPFWTGSGGVMSLVSDDKRQALNSWRFAGAKWESLMQTIVESPIHIICVVRTKTAFSNVNGHLEANGIRSNFRPLSDYYFQIFLEVHPSGLVFPLKDMTGVFPYGQYTQVTNETGKLLIPHYAS